MDSYEKGRRNEKSFKKGFLNQTQGEKSKYTNEPQRIQETIKEYYDLIEKSPHITVDKKEKVKEKIKELQGRLAAFHRGMEEGVFNPKGNIDEVYKGYIEDLDRELSGKDDDGQR